MVTPTDLVNDYMTARISRVPKTPYTQEQSERYSAEADDGNNDEYSRKRREEEEEEDVSRETFEKNAREGEREIEYNSQRELDDLEESASDYDDDDNHLEDTEFSGNYFEKPNKSENESLGDRIREKYDSFSEKIANSAGSAAGSFVSGFNKKMDSFERGDPLFSTKRPAKGRSIRYVSRPTRQNRNLSRPYVGGRFNDSLTLGTNGGYNPYYPVNEGRQSTSPQPMDMYLPSGAAYEGEFSGRKAFKQSEFSDEREKYDPFGYGGLSGDGFDNTSGFGSSLMGFGGDNGIFGGSAGQDNVFGNFGGGKTGKMDILGNTGMFTIGDLVSPPASRKTTTKRRKSASKTAAKKATKKTATKRKASARKQSYNGFALP